MLWLAFVCSHSKHVNLNRFETSSISLSFLFFDWKSPIFRFSVCNSIGFPELWEAKFKFCFFFSGKEISFLSSSNHYWGPPPHFMIMKNMRKDLKFSNVMAKLSEMMLLKSYATFCNQQLQILKKCCKSKNPNSWLQRKIHFEKEMYSSFLLILLFEAWNVKFQNYIKSSQIFIMYLVHHIVGLCNIPLKVLIPLKLMKKLLGRVNCFVMTRVTSLMN